MIGVARKLREAHDFRGYIHLKTIPNAAQELVTAAGRYADRISVNIELPTQAGLQRLAQEKNIQSIKLSMGRIRERIDEKAEEPKAPQFAPAGQSTQMIVGADGADDKTILKTATTRYSAYRLRRVYYSAFSPIPDSSAALPLQAPPLIREHRLYQADWLLRFYEFRLDEILPGAADAHSHLPLDIDPKLAWARNRHVFPSGVAGSSRHRARPALRY